MLGTGPPPEPAFPTTGLIGRLRGDSIVVADGAAIPSWAALVGGAATPGGGATYKAASALNGKPAARFVKASSHWLAWPSVSASINPVSLFIALRTPTGALAAGMPFGTNSVSTGGMYFRHAPIVSDASHAILLTFDNNASNVNNAFYVNNVGQSYSTRLTRTSAFGSGIGTNLGVDQWDTPDFLDGWIGEAAKWDHVLSGTERAALFAYTLSRYGV
jgi:hypothetical protein